jgi:hypothetical protein
MGRRFKLALVGSLLMSAMLGSFQQRIWGARRQFDHDDTGRLSSMAVELKNWGRWGPDDQLGTSNLITAAKIRKTAKLVRAGLVISLAHLEPQKVETDVPAGGVFHRVTNTITDTATIDSYQVSYHPSADPGSGRANVSSYRWQVHCRGLYQTPMAV